LQVSPSGVTTASCSTGAYTAITLSNTGHQSLIWDASLSGTAGASLSANSGTLAPGQSVTLQLHGVIAKPKKGTSQQSVTIITGYQSAGVSHFGSFLTENCK
jgi:hypothetical protein